LQVGSRSGSWCKWGGSLHDGTKARAMLPCCHVGGCAEGHGPTAQHTTKKEGSTVLGRRGRGQGSQKKEGGTGIPGHVRELALEGVHHACRVGTPAACKTGSLSNHHSRLKPQHPRHRKARAAALPGLGDNALRKRQRGQMIRDRTADLVCLECTRSGAVSYG
jgi:hypothetical protein